MVYTSPSKVARAMTLRRFGHSDQEIATSLGIHRTTVGRIIQRVSKSGDPYAVTMKSGRPRKLDDRDVRHMAVLLARSEVSNAAEISKKAFPDVSRFTIGRRLKEYGLVCRVRRSKPFISPVNKKKRHDWAKEHAGWDVEDWKRVVFSDESKFMLFKSDGRQYAYFRPGQALDPRYTKKTVKHGGGSLMVWGCMTSSGLGRIHRIEGIMTGEIYVEILENQLIGSLKDRKLRRVGQSSIIFQQDNDPKHTSHVATAFFARRAVKKLPWPPQSPDMNIIEHVWHQLDLKIRAHDPLPRNKDELWEAIKEEWENFPQEAIDKLYESMPRRVEALGKASGGHTKY